MKKLVEKPFFFSSLILSCEAWNILKLEKQKGNLMVFFKVEGFPGGSVAKNPPANAGDSGLIPRSGRSPGEGNGNQLQYSCLGNPMDRGMADDSP